jgi:hypothetical protein
MAFDFEQWSKAYPAWRGSPLFAGMIGRRGSSIAASGDQKKATASIRAQMLAAGESERSRLLTDYLRERLAKVLGLPGSMLSKLDVNLPMSRLGIDSLMAVEMKTLIRAELAVEVPTLCFFRGHSLAQLATEALNRFTAEYPLPQTSDAAPLSGKRPEVEGKVGEEEYARLTRVAVHHWEELII